MLKAKFIRGIAAGALLGAAAGIFIAPQMSHRTMRKVSRAGRRAVEFTGDIWEGLKNIGR